jgi:hypothetical protein
MKQRSKVGLVLFGLALCAVGVAYALRVTALEAPQGRVLPLTEVLARVPADSQLVIRIGLGEPMLFNAVEAIAKRQGQSAFDEAMTACGKDFLSKVDDFVISASEVTRDISPHATALLQGRFEPGELQACLEKLAPPSGARADFEGHPLVQLKGTLWGTVLSQNAVVYGSEARLHSFIRLADGRGGENLLHDPAWADLAQKGKGQPLWAGIVMSEGVLRELGDGIVAQVLARVDRLVVSGGFEKSQLTMHLEMLTTDDDKAGGVVSTLKQVAEGLVGKGETAAVATFERHVQIAQRGPRVEVALRLDQQETAGVLGRLAHEGAR